MVSIAMTPSIPSCSFLSWRNDMSISKHTRFALLASISLFTSAEAHDFWLQPGKFWLSPQESVPLTLQVGHGTDRQASKISPKRVTRFEAVAPDGTVLDLRSRWDEVSFREPGAYVLVLETDSNAHSHLPAARFNDYVKAEGLTPALEHRAETRQMDRAASEMYSRRAKALVQVGAPGGAVQTHVTQPMGLSLELVPEQNPYAVPRPVSLPVRVFYEGRPLAGALIKLVDLGRDDVLFESQMSDASGRAVFTMPPAGAWRLNVLWTKALPAAGSADYATIFSSLTFGLPGLDEAMVLSDDSVTVSIP
jgi:uncharacterized GH25 family protein